MHRHRDTERPRGGGVSRPAARAVRRGLGALALVAALLASLGAAPSSDESRDAASGPMGPVLTSASPAPGSIVHETPDEVVLTFDVVLDPDRSGAIVLGPSQEVVVEGDPPMEVDGDTITVQLAELTEYGTYSVLFVATDTADRETQGAYTFRFDPAEACGDLVRAQGAWLRISAPQFPQGPQKLTAFTISASKPNVMFATNGEVVMRSGTGGCTWEAVFTLPGISPEWPHDPATTSITDLVTPRSGHGSATRVLVVAMDEAVPGAAVPAMAFSTDGGRTFTTSQPISGVGTERSSSDLAIDTGSGIPGCRPPGPCAVTFAVSNPDIVYMALKQVNSTVSVLKSEDGGATFVPTGAALDSRSYAEQSSISIDGQLATSDAVDVAVDPLRSDLVWLSTGVALHRSADGGATFTLQRSLYDDEPRSQSIYSFLETTISESAVGDLAAVRISPPAEQTPPDAIVRTLVGADLWQATGLKADVRRPLQSFTRRNEHLYALTTRPGDGGGTLLFGDLLTETVRDLGTPSGPLQGVLATRGECGGVFAHDEDEIIGYLDTERLDPTSRCLPEVPLPDLPDVPAFEVPDVDLDVQGPVLAPKQTTVDLEPGEQRTLGYRFGRQAEGTPLDVAFLIDTSGSMQGTIDGISAGFVAITESLVSSGIDVNFGLAAFSGYDHRYERVRDIGPPDEEFSRVLARLTASGGGSEPHLTALHQLATGEGIESPGDGRPVPPGQQMNFRPGTLRVVVHASDEPFSSDPDGPQAAQTVRALNDKGILHIGLCVGTGNEISVGETCDPPGAVLQEGRLHGEMAALSRQTGALAVDDVDCDGDGRDDLEPGDPLTCEVSDDVRIAPAITDLLLAIRDERDVSLRPTVDDPLFTTSVRAVGPRARGDRHVAIDIKDQVDLTFGVTFGCEPAAAGTSTTVRLDGVLGGEAVTAATALVRCGPQPAPARPAAAGPQQPVALAAAPPPAPPPAPVPANAPAQASASSAASSASFSTVPGVTAVQAPAVAVATAPQTQVQVAQATVDRGGERHLEFSSLRRDRAPSPALPIGAAVMTGAAAALAAARRRRTQQATVRGSRPAGRR